LRKAWVKTLALDRVSNTPVVILGIEGTNRVLPIWIGACEGHALALAMEKMEFPRPLTHDLLLSVLESLEARVDKVIIHSLKDNTFYATLVIRDLTYTDEEDEEAALIDIDSRPSDAIILAVKTGAPIFVSDNLVEKHSIELEVNETQDEEEEFKKFVENLNIDTFKQMIEKKREEDEEGES
jgi:bifunctional DNase/RNase